MTLWTVSLHHLANCFENDHQQPIVLASSLVTFDTSKVPQILYGRVYIRELLAPKKVLAAVYKTYKKSIKINVHIMYNLFDEDTSL